MKKHSQGFTLIELLVVVAIIGLLSSIVFASLNSARAKARDAKVISEFRQLKTALALYYDKYGKYPNETAVTNGSDQWWGNFNNMAAQLVTEKFLATVPVNSAGTYSYYNYGGSTLGGLLVTELKTYPASSVGYPGSCRYDWGSGNTNWCNNNVLLPSTAYCICNPY